MKKALGLLAVLIGLLSGCGGGSNSSSSLGGGSTPPVVINNTQPVTIDAGPVCDISCGASLVGQQVGDNDLLFTSVTICVPGSTTNCQTIDHVQVDTGSVGLRLLASQVTLALPRQSAASGSPLANCVQYADLSYQFGPVAKADIQLAGEVASSVPIQLVGGNGIPLAPIACTAGGTPAQTINDLGAKGIIGVGLWRQDCGTYCVSTTANNVYFSCPTTGCVSTAVALTSELQNPVWMFPQDNNGLLISLPAVGASGQTSLSGSMIFGIATQTDNAVGALRAQAANGHGNFTTTFKGVAYSSSFIDSGSNGFFFLDSITTGLPACPAAQAPGFYCPAAPVAETAITSGPNPASSATTVSSNISFSVGNAVTLLNSPNTAFNNVGGSSPSTFDWGLPFFLGRNLMVGIESQTSPLGPGPFWAY